MRKFYIFYLLLLLAACKENTPEEQLPVDANPVSATASIPSGILTGWERGDTFLALEVNGTSVTPVTFYATAKTDAKASFKSSGAVPASASTKWVAVFGKGANFAGGSISCTYTSQDGSPAGIAGVDYMTATSSGDAPDFDFAGGKQLSHILEISAPEGVAEVEFNTCASGPEWLVGSDGTVSAQTADYHRSAVKSFKLKEETVEGGSLLLAVPALDYSTPGLIVTVSSADGSKSQGMTTSADLSKEGGKTGKYDMSAEPLIDRPAVADAIDFITGSTVQIEHLNNTSWEGLNDVYRFDASAKWAPFNLGAKATPATAEDTYGLLFSWGETELKEAYSWANYTRASDHEKIGYKREMTGSKDITLQLATISGTKYDVARVKWGKDWRMPFLEDILSLLGTNEKISTSADKREVTTGAMVTTGATTFNGVSVSGRTFTRNGRTLFLPYAGRYYYTEGKQTSTRSYEGKQGLYYCGTHNITSGSKEAYRLLVRDNQLDCDSQEAGYAFAIRPVLTLDSDEPALPVKVTGKVTDSTTGKGIEGVAVSDGFSFCKTASDGTYTLDADARARNICVTVPAAYEIPLGSDGRPAFYKLVKVSSYSGESIDFALKPRSNPGSKFTIITIADSHLKNESHIKHLNEVCVPDIKATISELESEGNAGTIIGIALGDQMWDCWGTDGIAASVRNFYTGFTTSAGTMPFFYVIGNHDHQSMVGKTDDVATELFIQNFAPRDYSFDIGNAHVIVMDGIDYKGTDEGEKITYNERITGEQLHWLKEDIANVEGKSGKVGIFCVHDPVYNGLGNRDEIQTLLRQFSEAHIYSGHIHNMTNKFFKSYTCKSGRTLREHNIQSLSGSWWEADLSPNGTPSGYGIYTFDGSGLAREYNKVIGESKDFQIRVYDGNGSYDGNTPNSGASKYRKNTLYSWDSQYKGKFLARVWDGEDMEVTSDEETWSVTFEKDGVSTPMTHVNEMVDKCAIGYIIDIMGSPYGMKDNGGGATSIGWWVIDAPGGNPSAVTGWKVVAKHTLPGGWSKTYSTSTLTKDYQGYSPGSHYKY